MDLRFSPRNGPCPVARHIQLRTKFLIWNNHSLPAMNLRTATCRRNMSHTYQRCQEPSKIKDSNMSPDDFSHLQEVSEAIKNHCPPSSRRAAFIHTIHIFHLPFNSHFPLTLPLPLAPVGFWVALYFGSGPGPKTIYDAIQCALVWATGLELTGMWTQTTRSSRGSPRSSTQDHPVGPS